MPQLTWVRMALTLSLMLLAGLLGHQLWQRSMYAPWTRDGRVQADVVHVATDVAGLVDLVFVHDNQFVRHGDRLFHIDDRRYRLALQRARASLAERQADLRQKRVQASRRAELAGNVVSAENASDAVSAVDTALARRDAAVAAVALAQFNLERTTVYAPVTGYVSNLKVHRGDYAQAGQALLALIDSHSFAVYGYFEETKIHRIHVGDAVTLHLMSGDPDLSGHVESIARGITDRDNSQGQELLANVNPTFSWVRLAQRIPVRVLIDHLPETSFLAAGMTCTVIVHPRQASSRRP